MSFTATRTGIRDAARMRPGTSRSHRRIWARSSASASLDFHLGLMNRPRRHRPRAGLVLGDHRLEHGKRESRRGVILELSGVQRQLARALADGMRNHCAQIAGGEIDRIRFAHVCREVARQLPLEPIEVPLKLRDRKSTRLNSSHSQISYAVFCLKKKKTRKKKKTLHHRHR